MLSNLPTEVINYLINNVSKQPYFNELAFSISCMDQSIPTPIYLKLVSLNSFLRRAMPTSTCKIIEFNPSEAVKKIFYENRCDIINFVGHYKYAIASVDFYIDSLPKENSHKLERYRFPRIDATNEIWEIIKYCQQRGQIKKKSQTDPVVKHFAEILRISKCHSDWIIKAYQNIIEIKKEIVSGKIIPPIKFEIQSWDLSSMVSFVIWDKRSWVLNHASKYTHSTLYTLPPYGQSIFLQYEGEITSDCWFLRAFQAGVNHGTNKNNEDKRIFLKNENISTNFRSGMSTTGLLIPSRGMGIFLAKIREHIRGTDEEKSFFFDFFPLVPAAVIGNLAIQALGFCGVRVSELQQITRERDCIVLEKILHGEKTDFDVKFESYYCWYLRTKNHDNIEKVFVYPTVMESLLTFLDLFRDFHDGILPGKVNVARKFTLSRLFTEPHSFIFQWNGKHLSSGTINACIEFTLLNHLICDEKRHPIRITTSSLRHGLAGYLHLNGVPIQTIGQFLHQNQYKVALHYGHIPDEDIAEKITPITHSLGDLIDFSHKSGLYSFASQNNLSLDLDKKVFHRVIGGWCKNSIGCSILERCPGCPYFQYVPNRKDEITDLVKSCNDSAQYCRNKNNDPLTFEARHWESIAQKWSRIQKSFDDFSPVLQLEESIEPLETILPLDKFYEIENINTEASYLSSQKSHPKLV